MFKVIALLQLPFQLWLVQPADFDNQSDLRSHAQLGELVAQHEEYITPGSMVLYQWFAGRPIRQLRHYSLRTHRWVQFLFARYKPPTPDTCVQVRYSRVYLKPLLDAAQAAYQREQLVCDLEHSKIGCF